MPNIDAKKIDQNTIKFWRFNTENCDTSSVQIQRENLLSLLDLASKALATPNHLKDVKMEQLEIDGLCRRLEEHATDWNGAQMPDGEPAKGDPTAGTLRQAATLICSLSSRAKEEAERERDRLRDVIERDRTKTTEIIGGIRAVVGRWSWLGEGRGSYAWDDDRYQDEFRQMLDALKEATDPLRALAADWTDCPQDYQAARIDWKARAETAETRAEELEKALDREIAHADELRQSATSATMREAWDVAYTSLRRACTALEAPNA